MKTLLISILALLSFQVSADDYPEYEKHVYTDKKYSSKASLPYRMLLPANFDSSKSYPLILFLHGAGERGNDNEAQLTHGAALFLNPSFRNRIPAVVVFPQAAQDDYWVNVDVDRSLSGNTFYFKADAPKTQSMSLLLDLIDELGNRAFIDQHNMLVMGLSMGGMGTYDLLATRPNTFKAAVAICGGAHPQLGAEIAPTPVWAFHGDQDKVVPLSASQVIVDAINTKGGNAKLTVYEGVEHNSWDNAFAEPELLTWMFSHVDTF
ncbi:prolyl oligopeptidase family serine peptidase [Ningiella sp. W23]|uniref:carboxylesterase family protein n=1 Tax=Ningiella sp. W23 TaxID=3023715 RepID=UPI003757EC4D